MRGAELKSAAGADVISRSVMRNPICLGALSELSDHSLLRHPAQAQPLPCPRPA